MNYCLCGCGTETKGQWAQGHHKRPVAVDVDPTRINYTEAARVPPEVLHEIARMPPNWPLPFDHRLYRLAVEPPGTLMTDPWKAVPCAECKEICFTRQKNAEYGEVICEEDLWRLMEDRGELQVKQNRTMARVPRDPFA